jgi:uncharacterized LabA/DUF88 family protein
LAHQERVNIAVFIDFDNIEIGVKTTLGEHFDIGTILEALKERGEVVTKIAYADWTRAGEYSRALTAHAIRLVQRNLTPGGDKNGADINLALDALEMAFTHPHINAYVIVGGDSDFLSLVEKLKQYDKKVFVVGGRAFTSTILQRNCHEFIAYENLVRKPASSRSGRPPASTTVLPIAQALPLVRRALKILADREVSPQTGLLKSTLLQLDSTFSERNYGASSFLDFVEKLAQVGLVQLKHSGRSVMVELNAGFDDGETAQTAQGRVSTTEAAGDRPAAEQDQAAGYQRNEVGESSPDSSQSSVFPQAGTSAEGVRIAGELLKAATNARWPMYVRNVKQILRGARFDERRYGFTGLVDLLRACGREGLIRLERDRRGGLRAFQGPALTRGGGAPSRVEPTDVAAPAEVNEVPIPPTETAEPAATPEPEEVVDVQPVVVVDTTAELLGRAEPKRTRTRVAAGGAAARGSRAPAHVPARKPAARRARASKKTTTPTD